MPCRTASIYCPPDYKRYIQSTSTIISEYRVYIAPRNLLIVSFTKINKDIFRISVDRKLQLHMKSLASSVLTSTCIHNWPTISSIHLSQKFDKQTKSRPKVLAVKVPRLNYHFPLFPLSPQ